MNRKMAAILQERQAQLAQQPTRGDSHSPRNYRPSTAGATSQGTRPKVTCAMLNETERMLLKAPTRHKSMLSAGAHKSTQHARAFVFDSARLQRSTFFPPLLSPETTLSPEEY